MADWESKPRKIVWCNKWTTPDRIFDNLFREDVFLLVMDSESRGWKCKWLSQIEASTELSSWRSSSGIPSKDLGGDCRPHDPARAIFICDVKGGI